MSGRFNKHQIAEFKKAFSQFEKKDGIIDQQQFGIIMRSLGHDLSDAEFLEIAKRADIEGDGYPDIEEFMEINKRLHADKKKPMLMAIKVEDLDKTGKISASQLRQVFEENSDTLTDEDIAEYLRHAVLDDQGMLDYHDFVEKCYK